MRTLIFAARFLDQKLGHLFVALLVSLLGPCVAVYPSKHDVHNWFCLVWVLCFQGVVYSWSVGCPCMGMHPMGYSFVTPPSIHNYNGLCSLVIEGANDDSMIKVPKMRCCSRFQSQYRLTEDVAQIHRRVGARAAISAAAMAV